MPWPRGRWSSGRRSRTVGSASRAAGGSGRASPASSFRNGRASRSAVRGPARGRRASSVGPSSVTTPARRCAGVSSSVSRQLGDRPRKLGLLASRGRLRRRVRRLGEVAIWSSFAPPRRGSGDVVDRAQGFARRERAPRFTLARSRSVGSSGFSARRRPRARCRPAPVGVADSICRQARVSVSSAARISSRLTSGRGLAEARIRRPRSARRPACCVPGVSSDHVLRASSAAAARVASR